MARFIAREISRLWSTLLRIRTSISGLPPPPINNKYPELFRFLLFVLGIMEARVFCIEIKACQGCEGSELGFWAYLTWRYGCARFICWIIIVHVDEDAKVFANCFI